MAIAFVIGAFIRPFVRDQAIDLSFAQPTVALLSIPLILSFFTLVALRVLFAVPTEIDAKWIFQMSESDDKSRYVSGARKAMLLFGLLPIAALTLPLYWTYWGAGLAVAHTVGWLLLAFLLTEALLVRFQKTPFACSYIPGKANVRLLWPVYLFVMTTYAYTTARYELSLLDDDAPGRLVVACVAMAGAWVALVFYRRRGGASDPLTYDETVDPTVQTLDLMRPV